MHMPFLMINHVSHHLTAVRVSFSALTWFGDKKGLWLIKTCATYLKLEYGPMSNMKAALPNIGGTICSMPQSFADAHY